MNGMLHKKKLFGVALDASDDPMSLELKWASMMSREKSDDPLYTNPYDALVQNLPNGYPFDPAGKFPVPSWLWPRPLPADRPLVNSENYQRFYDNKGFLKTSKQIKDFVAKNILPGTPVMIGIDHSTTGGVLSALADRYSAEMISVIVLDRHFDAIPPSTRMDASLRAHCDTESDLFPMPFSTSGSDEYCCGNFWAYLMDNGVVLPENLLFIGVADYPTNNMSDRCERFRKAYLIFEERGCRFFPLWRFKEPYMDRLTRFIKKNVTTPHVYISLDLDVGALNCIHAARYMDGRGINKKNLLDVGGVIAKSERSGIFSLIGFDIMEFNMHFLGMKTSDGFEDLTLDVVREYMMTLNPT